MPFALQLAMPGSKSYANRAIIAACLANGTTTLLHATPCDDVALMVENLMKMGFKVRWIDAATGELEIHGGIPAAGKSDILFCENAGTTVRFLTSLACIVPGNWTITGNDHMLKRPIRDLVAVLRSLGADISDTDGCPPVTIRGGTLKGGKAVLDASKSSQFLSSVLLISPMMEQGIELELSSTLASPSYVTLTENIMSTFGVKVEHKTENTNTFIVRQSQYSAVPSLAVEGDWSAAGAFIVLSALTGGTIDYLNLDPQSQQGDRALVDGIKMLMQPGDFEIDCTDIPDQVMNLALFAAYRRGMVTITGAKNLRLKECDRLHVITTELQKAGIDITEQEDGLIIRGKPPQNRGTITLDPHDDHRMAMCFGILGCLHPGIVIKNPACVSKSYPAFFTDLEKMHRSAKPIFIVGMRGSGKSNLGRRLAPKLTLRHIDTDRIFEAKHGKIAEYVAKHGWPAFREEEEKIIADSFVPGVVVSVGGGAIESEKTRALLKRAIVIWVKMSEQGTVKRLQLTKRPALTDLPLEEEVKQVLQKRDPLYRAVATLPLPESVPFSQQLPYLMDRILLRPRLEPWLAKSAPHSRSHQ